MSKSQTKQIADSLHERGLRKRVARSVAGALGSDGPKRSPSRAARVADELRCLARDIEEHPTGRTQKRRAAARKAARTRARNAKKRSAAARKAGRKRSDPGARGKTRSR